ncbi:MAG: fumarylacetoacetate hydrolase family protein, partial [Roseiarcus sp.]
KIICLGLNYADHAKEGGHAKPEYPSFFLRCASSLVAHGRPILRPRVSIKLDYEAELVAIVGKTARNIDKANALSAIAGYSCFNDGSIRDYQRKTSQWTIGKNFDRTGGFGPAFVSADEVAPGGAGLRIQSILNGQVMQDANTSDMLVPVAETVVLLTECMTLEPGDLLVMGTPAGVGHARNPPVWMKAGDTIDIVIEGVGTLSNPVADGP